MRPTSFSCSILRDTYGSEPGGQARARSRARWAVRALLTDMAHPDDQAVMHADLAQSAAAALPMDACRRRCRASGAFVTPTARAAGSKRSARTSSRSRRARARRQRARRQRAKGARGGADASRVSRSAHRTQQSRAFPRRRRRGSRSGCELVTLGAERGACAASPFSTSISTGSSR